MTLRASDALLCIPPSILLSISLSLRFHCVVVISKGRRSTVVSTQNIENEKELVHIHTIKQHSHTYILTHTDILDGSSSFPLEMSCVVCFLFVFFASSDQRLSNSFPNTASEAFCLRRSSSNCCCKALTVASRAAMR